MENCLAEYQVLDLFTYSIYKVGRNVHCHKRPCPKCPWPKRPRPKYLRPKRPLAEMSADHRNIHI
jgi:hypothetical protein